MQRIYRKQNLFGRLSYKSFFLALASKQASKEASARRGYIVLLKGPGLLADTSLLTKVRQTKLSIPMARVRGPTALMNSTLEASHC